MKTIDTSEKGLESIIVASLVNEAGYIQGDSKNYDREHAVDLAQLMQFLTATQPDTVAALGIADEGPKRTQFLHRLQGEIAKRGVIDILRKGIKHIIPATVDLFYGTPTRGNIKATERFAANIFSVTRQLRYSRTETALSLDLAMFINGLPVATFELKNKLTKQTVMDAVQQYQRDRDPKELLFQFGRCAVHFAVDDHEVRFCTHLQGKHSWFLPFNKGAGDGAGNPPNPLGIATDYLWKEILTREGLTDILENYAQVVEEKDLPAPWLRQAGEKTGKKRYKQIFPRYHQLKVVRLLLADAESKGAGKRYMIQHSAGSGKSNSIAWLTHQLVGLERNNKALFDSVIVVTDRRVLDKQIRDTIRQSAEVSATVGHAENAADLRQFLASGKKIIITTVQKFPFILDGIGDEHRRSTFAIIIDEAHSSQGGRTSAKMNIALAEPQKAYVSSGPDTALLAADDTQDFQSEEEEEDTVEDKIYAIMQNRKMLMNASYFAFTATPKNKTLEVFGEPAPQPDGAVKHYPFHSYTMKQAIQEGFILDVLKSYTPVESYFRIIKTLGSDPLFDKKKAKKKLRRYVESHQYPIRQKAEIMVDHFHEQVAGQHKVGGKARAMVVTSGIERAIQYYQAFNEYLKERKSPYSAIVAFSGKPEFNGRKVTESTMNGFPGSQIAERFQQDPYRFLIVADKFQTGYDEPLLHTMYVDKELSGIKAVQTLSRLNRAHQQKYDTFVLDFYNDAETIQKAFEPYYRTTILSNETNPNKLHDLASELDEYRVYTQQNIDDLVAVYLGDGNNRDKLDPVLDACVATYKVELDEDGQVAFKSKAKAFVRTYNFLASILTHPNAAWEKLAIFLNFLIPKLPAPREEDLSRGILEAIDMESYHAEIKANLKISLADQDAEIDPFNEEGGGRTSEPDPDKLSNIVKAFNDQFGNIEWKDADKIRSVIAEEIPAKVAADTAYQNAMKNNNKKTARIEHDAALQRVMIDLLTDHTELFKQFSDNPSFKKWLGDTIFGVTYKSDRQTAPAARQGIPV